MLRIRLTCPNHPKYDPHDRHSIFEVDCIYCGAMREIYYQVRQLEYAIDEFRHTETPKDFV